MFDSPPPCLKPLLDIEKSLTCHCHCHSSFTFTCHLTLSSITFTCIVYPAFLPLYGNVIKLTLTCESLKNRRRRRRWRWIRRRFLWVICEAGLVARDLSFYMAHWHGFKWVRDSQPHNCCLTSMLLKSNNTVFRALLSADQVKLPTVHLYLLLWFFIMHAL